MTIQLSRRMLYLAVVASLVLVVLAAVTGPAWAQGKPEQLRNTPRAERDAPNTYPLQGDATNTGAAVTYFDSTSSVSGGAWQFSTDAQDGTVIGAFCMNPSSWNCWGVSGAAY